MKPITFGHLPCCFCNLNLCTISLSCACSVILLFVLTVCSIDILRSVSGEQRETVVDAFIANDLFGCRPISKQNGYSLVQLLRSPSAVVRQYTARVYNALSSLQKGDLYKLLLTA